MKRNHPENGETRGEPATGATVSLRDIGRDAAILTAVLTAASLLLGSRPITAGVALGGLLALFNWVWLKRFVGAVFLARGGKVSRVGAGLYAFKYLLTFAVVWVAFRYRLVDVFALMTGLLVVIMAI